MARILLVDDEAALRGVLERILMTEEHEVTTASDGRGALAAAAAGTFDVLVTDLVMPDIEGIETITKLRRSHPALKIIAMSGGGRGSAEDYLLIAKGCGAAKTLAKPFAAQELLDAVREVLAG